MEQQKSEQVRQQWEEHQLELQRTQIQQERIRLETQLQAAMTQNRSVREFDADMVRTNLPAVNRSEPTLRDALSVNFPAQPQIGVGCGRGRGRGASATITTPGGPEIFPSAQASSSNENNNTTQGGNPEQFSDAPDNFMIAQQLADDNNLYHCRETGIRSLQRHGLWQDQQNQRGGNKTQSSPEEGTSIQLQPLSGQA